MNTASPLAFRAFRGQGGFPKAGWLPVEGSQRRDREALEAPKGAAKTPICGVAYMDVGKGREQDAEGLLFLPRATAIAGEERLAE